MSSRKRKSEFVANSSSLRVASYLRVSTDRQQKHALSLEDQRAKILSWCDDNGHQAVAEFIEGASATDDKRPVFQQMIERACDGDNAFDVIAVHSYSRFFRDAFGQALEHGVMWTGTTIHIVDEDVDHGPIVYQRPVPVKGNDTYESLKARIQRAEYKAYPRAIKMFLEGKPKVVGRRIIFENGAR